MQSRSTGKAMAALTDQVAKTPGWTVTVRKNSRVTVRAPGGELLHYNLGGAANGKVSDVRGRLRNVGWDPEGAEKAKEREAKRRLAEARQRTESALEKAQREGEARAHAEALAKARTRLTQTETGLRAARLAHERAERDHRQALDHLTRLEQENPA
ncbi:hypothetical protein ACWF95_38930 [Streptomyces vinaceus]